MNGPKLPWKPDQGRVQSGIEERNSALLSKVKLTKCIYTAFYRLILNVQLNTVQSDGKTNVTV